MRYRAAIPPVDDANEQSLLFFMYLIEPFGDLSMSPGDIKQRYWSALNHLKQAILAYHPPIVGCRNPRGTQRGIVDDDGAVSDLELE